VSYISFPFPKLSWRNRCDRRRLASTVHDPVALIDVNKPALLAQRKIVDEQLERDDLLKERREKLETDRRELQSELNTPGRLFAVFLLKNWKFQKHLYERFGGGRILWQQSGLEAFDSRREWLETLEKRGDFRITDPELRSVFYEYWTTMNHGSFLTGDKGRIKREFLKPEWLQTP